MIQIYNGEIGAVLKFWKKIDFIEKETFREQELRKNQFFFFLAKI